MKSKIFSFVQYHRVALILILVILVGAMLRLTHFHAWLRFNDDQVRDALIVERMIESHEFPLLGPKAGGTGFNLGPAFYYVEYVSAFVFGDRPESLAYPIVLLSILSLPLFFLLFRQYFDVRITILLTALFACSFFAVKYSRFAWNPNLIPFFLLAFFFLLLDMLNRRDQEHLGRSALLGIVIGIGIQFHTLLLLLFPLVSVGVFLFLFAKGVRWWKSVAFIATLVALLNAPFLVSEYRSGGENMRAFFRGAEHKTDEDTSLLETVKTGVKCYTQGNVAILSSLGDLDGCKVITKSDRKSWVSMARGYAGYVFFGASVILLLFVFRKESDLKRRNFLGLSIAYLLVSFAVFFPLSEEVSLRFFLALILFPFLFLGLWIELLSNTCRSIGFAIAIVVVLLLVGLNLFTYQATFIQHGDEVRNENFGGMRLGEAESMAQFIKEKTPSDETALVDEFEHFRSLEYAVEQAGRRIETFSGDDVSGKTVFFVSENENREKKRAKLTKKYGSVDVQASFDFYTLFLVKR